MIGLLAALTVVARLWPPLPQPLSHCTEPQRVCALGEAGRGQPGRGQKGLWLLPRKDPQNTARADVPGRMRAAPTERWAIGPGRRGFSAAWSVGRDYLLLTGSALARRSADGKTLWRLPNLGAIGVLGVLDFPGKGHAALVMAGGGNLVQVDLSAGKVLWRWQPPPKAQLGQPVLWRDGDSWRLVLFPQNTLDGIAFELTAPDAPPKPLWQQTYTGKFWANFGPYGVAADMNNDGRRDIVLAAKPSTILVLDGDTGKILFDRRYPIPGAESDGRPYGFLEATDFDGDGFKDVVMASCQVEEYVGVLKNHGGKALELSWARFVENDLPDDYLELRPQVTSCADIDGDGKKELVVGLFNLTGDNKWHTVAFDPFGGWDARKLDLVDRYFWGTYDLDGDGRPELLTSTETARRFAATATLQAVDGKTGKDRVAVESAAFVAVNRPLPDGVGFFGGRASFGTVVLSTGERGVLVRRAGGEFLWSLNRSGESVFIPFTPTPLARSLAFSRVEERVDRLDHRIVEPAEPVVANAFNALVAVADGRRELIVARGDGTIDGGAIDPKRSGQWKSHWTILGVCPAVWIGPDGERIVAAFDLDKDRFYLYRPRAGQRFPEPIATVELPYLPYRAPGMLLPFGNAELRVYAGMKTGVHTTAGALYDRSGKLLWRDDKDGPYPRPAGVRPGTDGPELVVDNHGKILFYDAAGKPAMIAHGWNDTVPGRGNGGKYVLPILGPFGPGGALRIVLSPGLENLEVLDGAGARLAMSPFGAIYEREWCGSAVAQLRPGQWDIGMMTNQGVFHCADLATGKDRWIRDMGVKATYPMRIAAGDLDGDGRDEFLVALSNGELVALTEKDGQGAVLWTVTLDAAIREVALADVDGDGFCEIVVETDDNRVRVLGSGG